MKREQLVELGPRREQMIVAKINDYEWWVGESVEACVQSAAQEYGHAGNAEDMEQYEGAYALSDEQLDGLRYFDADEDERPTGEARTFREQLASEVADGGHFPRVFAVTDY